MRLGISKLCETAAGSRGSLNNTHCYTKFFTDDKFNPSSTYLQKFGSLRCLNRSSADVEQTHQTCYFYNEIYCVREGEFPLSAGISNFPIIINGYLDGYNLYRAVSSAQW